MNRLRLCIVLLALSSAVVVAQAAPQSESGKFRLHKFEQPIGEESYTITADGSTLTLKTDFKFTDRGTDVPLTATLRTSDSYVPQSFVITGKTSRMSDIDTAVTVDGAKATIRQGKDTRSIPAPPPFFTISGYAPVAVQMEMMRYWRTHGSPAQMATLPIGAVRIQDRGSETMQINGQRRSGGALHRAGADLGHGDAVDGQRQQSGCTGLHGCRVRPLRGGTR